MWLAGTDKGYPIDPGDGYGCPTCLQLSQLTFDSVDKLRSRKILKIEFKSTSKIPMKGPSLPREGLEHSGTHNLGWRRLHPSGCSDSGNTCDTFSIHQHYCNCFNGVIEKLYGNVDSVVQVHDRRRGKAPKLGDDCHSRSPVLISPATVRCPGIGESRQVSRSHRSDPGSQSSKG